MSCFAIRISLAVWSSLLVGWSVLAGAEDAVRMRELFPTGYQYHVSSRVDLSGTLTVPDPEGKSAPRSLSVTGTSAIEYDERVLAATNGEVEKTARIYRRVDFQRKVGAAPQQSTVRPNVRRLVLIRLKTSEVPFSPDGPLTWGEIDTVRTDVFTPALAGLLPEGVVRIGDRWKASDAAVQELTDLEKVEQGNVQCRLESLTTLENRRHARVSLSGTVSGVNEDGPNRQELDGHIFFDLESQHIGYLSVKGVHVLLDKNGKEMGRVSGRFVLTRQAHQRCPDLTDSALKGVALVPNEDNTRLLYDNPDLGVRFLHPRRWRMGGVRGSQVVLDETKGSGLLLTLEPLGRLPTASQYLVESRDWLKQQQGRVLRESTPQRVEGALGDLERFTIDMELADKRAIMDYYVIRQPQGGATVAARLLPNDLANLQREVERIAQSVTITRPIVEPRKR